MTIAKRGAQAAIRRAHEIGVEQRYGFGAVDIEGDDGAPLGALMLGAALLFSFWQLRRAPQEATRDWERRGLSWLAVAGLLFLYLTAPLCFGAEGTAITWALAGLATLFVGLRLQTRSFLFTAFAVQLLGGAVFLTQSHPKQTQGSDLWVGTPSLDQIYAKRFGQDTPLPSMQFCIENLDQSGGCTYNYSCAYTDTISWSSPSEPMPMIRDPRVAFDMLFGAGASPEERAERRADRAGRLCCHRHRGRTRLR
jgi:hypothetical protein